MKNLGPVAYTVDDLKLKIQHLQYSRNLEKQKNSNL